MGDPCGVGPEIIVKAQEDPLVGKICTPFVIGDGRALERALGVCGSELSVYEINAPEEARKAASDTIPLLSLSRLDEADLIYGRPTVAAGEAAYRYICAAARFCLGGRAAAMVTAPISK